VSAVVIDVLGLCHTERNLETMRVIISENAHAGVSSTTSHTHPTSRTTRGTCQGTTGHVRSPRRYSSARPDRRCG
jgi:hypothetical protein